MNPQVSALLAGIVFGLGLWISGMATPQKVLGFLDVTGKWDPTLAFVMAGAVGVTLAAFGPLLRREAPLFAREFSVGNLKSIDTRLVLGAAIFGAGWGIAGYCPGPALTALASFSAESAVFVTAMIAGGVLHSLLDRLPEPVPKA